MTNLNEILSDRWRARLADFDRIYVGFSGGLDSTVLLHVLTACPELFDKLSPIHIHHGLSPHADHWQQHCQMVCDAWTLPCQVMAVQCQAIQNVEESARDARYQAFSGLVHRNDCLLTAHHQQDQAETLLLHLFRGAGVSGLCGIAESMPFAKGELLRPLLSIAQQTLLAYAAQNQLRWIDDESNQNIRYSRNFIRHQVLPLIQNQWTGVIKNLARTTRLCHRAQANLEDLALIDYPAFADSSSCAFLLLNPLRQLTEHRLVNVLRYWLKVNDIRPPNEETLLRIMTEVIAATSDADPSVSWGTTLIKRYHDQLYLLSLDSQDESVNPAVIHWANFPEPIELAKIGILSAANWTGEIQLPADARVEIRFRQGGETFFWHGHTQSLKKLMQAWCIPPWMRHRVPLIYVNNQLVAVYGYTNPINTLVN